MTKIYEQRAPRQQTPIFDVTALGKRAARWTLRPESKTTSANVGAPGGAAKLGSPTASIEQPSGGGMGNGSGVLRRFWGCFGPGQWPEERRRSTHHGGDVNSTVRTLRGPCTAASTRGGPCKRAENGIGRADSRWVARACQSGYHPHLHVILNRTNPPPSRSRSTWRGGRVLSTATEAPRGARPTWKAGVRPYLSIHPGMAIGAALTRKTASATAPPAGHVSHFVRRHDEAWPTSKRTRPSSGGGGGGWRGTGNHPGRSPATRDCA